jgi:hypothetical protein
MLLQRSFFFAKDSIEEPKFIILGKQIRKDLFIFSGRGLIFQETFKGA